MTGSLPDQKKHYARFTAETAEQDLQIETIASRVHLERFFSIV